MQDLENDGPNHRLENAGPYFFRHFPRLAFPSPAIWSVVLEVVQFTVHHIPRPAFFSLSSFWSIIFRSCKISALKSNSRQVRNIRGAADLKGLHSC